MNYPPLRRPIWPYVAFLLAALVLSLFWAANADARAVHAGAPHVRSGSAHAASHANNRNANRSVNRNVDRNVNRNVNRDVNVHRDIDIDVDVDNGWDGHPVARGVAFGTAAAVTAAAVGSVVYSIPPHCGTVYRGGVNYYSCDGILYEPRYVGTSVTYVVVEAP